MELIFLGRGAAFNPKEGNNSAYFIDKKQLFLVDCGESVFEKVITGELLNEIDMINVMITHTHSDHIGSLGSLVMYSYYKMHQPLNIIISSEAKYLSNIRQILSGFGCNEMMYSFVDEKRYDCQFDMFNNIRYVETKHCDELDCYGILFDTSQGIVYYSGDTKDTTTINQLIDSKQLIDKMYIDTTNDDYPGNVHLYIGHLDRIIPKELKDSVYCMHINSADCIIQAESLGFNVVKVKK